MFKTALKINLIGGTIIKPRPHEIAASALLPHGAWHADQPAKMSSESSEQQTESEGPVLVTGFGPFGRHAINASWEAVKELGKLGIEYKSKKVSLETREIPVVYDEVSSTVPGLHEEVNPRMCVHVGVSPYTVMKLERCGRNKGYQMKDIYGRTPSSECCVSGGPDAITTRFDIDKVCQKFSLKQNDVRVLVSEDAGRYLCDFIYYTSLHTSKAPVLFVHVPELGNPYSASQLAHALRDLIQLLLEELNN